MNDALTTGKGPELLMDLASETACLLTDTLDLTPEDAYRIGAILSERMVERWAGERLYFPKGSWNGKNLFWWDQAERDLKIYSEFNGRNRAELAAKYNISTRRIYQIIEYVRHRRKTHGQHSGGGPYARVRAGFIRQGTSLNRWCKENGVNRQDARKCLLGTWNGPKARQLRARLRRAAVIHPYLHKILPPTRSTITK